jgi:glycosidase
MKSQHSLLRTIQKMISIRKGHAALSGDMQWLEVRNSAVLAYVRKNADEAILVLNNLSDHEQIAQIPAEYQVNGLDLCENRACTLSAQIILPPYSYRWIKL